VFFTPGELYSKGSKEAKTVEGTPLVSKDSKVEGAAS